MIDKKCINCPIRKIALKSTTVLQHIFKFIEGSFDVLSDIDLTKYKYREMFNEVVKDEYCRCRNNN